MRKSNSVSRFLCQAIKEAMDEVEPMCLAVPGRIVELNGDDAIVDFNGVRRKAVVSFIQEPAIGDCVLLHAGFAIRKWDEKDMREYEEATRGLDLSRSPDGV